MTAGCAKNEPGCASGCAGKPAVARVARVARVFTVSCVRVRVCRRVGACGCVCVGAWARTHGLSKQRATGATCATAGFSAQPVAQPTLNLAQPHINIKKKGCGDE